MIEKTAVASEASVVTATRFSEPIDSGGFPPPAAWERAAAIRFAHDWGGRNADPERQTEVRLLWTPEALYLRFVARYRTLTVFDDAELSGRRDQLWDRDVAEAFLQPPGLHGRNYKEIEVSPNGFWIDLEIAAGEKWNLQSGLHRRVRIDEKGMTWQAELALPMKSLAKEFDPEKPWRVNFYRVEGSREPRFYSAWRPTGTAVPNFHVPESFGTLVFGA